MLACYCLQGKQLASGVIGLLICQSHCNVSGINTTPCTRLLLRHPLDQRIPTEPCECSVRVASRVAANLCQALVLVVATIENPDSQRYVVVNGRRHFTALSARQGYSFEPVIQKGPRSAFAHCNFKVLS